MSISRHIIKKQIIELLLGEQKESAELQEEVSELYNREILPAVDQLFSEIAGPGEYISIDQLDIDLGVIHKNSIQKDILEKTVLKIREKLEELIATEPVKNQVRKQSFVLQMDVLRHFLHTGRLPWNFDKGEFKSFKKLFGKVLTAQTARVLEMLQDELKKESVRKRLAAHISDAGLIRFFQFIVPGDKAQIKTITDKIIKDTRKSFEKRNAQYPARRRDYLIRLAILSLVAEEDVIKESISDFHKFEKTVREHVVAYLKRSRKKSIEEEVERKSSGRKVLKEKVYEEIYVDHAGVILFWPYLTLFFKGLGLLNEDIFASTESSHKAVCLLHYLATGKEASDEAGLVLNKLLCGLPLDEPIEFFPLTANDKVEAEHLIKTVIAHWTSLKETSVEAFRETFINREAYLEDREEHGWLLKVDRKGVDMLLNTLPWGIGMIKFSWSERIVYVDW